MFVTDWEKSVPKPPKVLLEQCYTVRSTSSKPHLKKRWALAHCASYVWMDVEFGGIDGDIYVFYFVQEADKLMFALKYN